MRVDLGEGFCQNRKFCLCLRGYGRDGNKEKDFTNMHEEGMISGLPVLSLVKREELDCRAQCEGLSSKGRSDLFLWDQKEVQGEGTK